MNTKELPIIFNDEMVRAILDGRKTQTRRIVKPSLVGIWDEPRGPEDVAAGYPFVETDDGFVSARKLCPFGQPGDRLWVKETHAIYGDENQAVIHYKATHQNDGSDWKSPVVMPRWASRITLEITGVRVERLNDISEADAIAEGVWTNSEDARSAATRGIKLNHIGAFVSLWESIYGQGSWNENQWVWVIEFKQLQNNTNRNTK